jgi:ribosomal-protein-alanine N-acetyltransferase
MKRAASLNSATPVLRPEGPRLANAADGEQAAAVHASAFPKADAWSSDVFSLQLALPNVIGLIWPKKGIILARQAASEAEILTVAVSPAVRRRGIATVLLREALVRLAASGVDNVFLEVSIANTAGQGLYTGFGFVTVGRRPRYYSDGSDALVLRLDLPLAG